VSKKSLITGLQVLFQNQRLIIPTQLEHAPTLTRELITYQPRVVASADPSQLDWRDGKNDDLVLALGLACWMAERLQDEDDSEPSVGMLMQSEFAHNARFRGTLRSRFPDRFGRPDAFA
jgi:hypothetical protein